MQIGPIEKRTHTKERTMLLIFIFGSCYCIIMMHCLQKSICDSHLSEDDLIFIVWKWSPRETWKNRLAFCSKKSAEQGFFIKVLTWNFICFLQGLPRITYLDVILRVILMYICFFDSAHEFLSLNFQMEKKAGKNPFLILILPSEKKNSARAVDLTFRG